MERPDMSSCSEPIRSYVAFQEAQLVQTKEQLVQKEAQLAQKDLRIENLTNMFLNLQKKQYGSSSEKNAVPVEVGEQLSMLFNEAEATADPKVPDETTLEQVKARTRKLPKGRQESLLKNMPVHETLYELPKDETACPKCGETLEQIGREYLRTTVEYIPAHVEATKYYRGVYACKHCDEDLSVCESCDHADEKLCSSCADRPRTVIVQAPVPAAVTHPVLKHSLASASSVANVLYSKYVQAVPLYRQVQDWKRAGLELNRATLANWVVAVARDWLQPMAGCLKKQLLSGTVIHCDETPVQVLREAGKAPTSTSYMWVYRSGEAEEHPVVLYDYQPTRSGDAAKRFLNGFTGYFVADGYGGYSKVVAATRCGCWAHVRRKFLEASSGGTQETTAAATKGVRFCDELFRLERAFGKLTPEERQAARLQKSKPVLEAFWAWIQGLDTMKNFAITKATGYATGQKACLESFLLDGRIPLSNNADENAIRPFVVGRKNWLFCNTPGGATASATVYSIVQTATLNGLDVYKYLRFLLERFPVLGKAVSDEELEMLAPWGYEARAVCRVVI